MKSMKAPDSALPKSDRALIGLLTGWTLSAVVVILAIIVWGSSFEWHFQGLSTYQIFPVLGLLAFSLMWAHYMMGLAKRLFFAEELESYYRWTGYAVLVLILAHPSILAYQRLRDGFGLPPGSETSYVAPSMAWIVALGMLSLLVFLAYEFRRWFDKRKWYKYVVYLGDVAMVAIFYHALELGTQTHIGWFRDVWWFYGVTLVGVILYSYAGKIWHLPGYQQE